MEFPPPLTFAAPVNQSRVIFHGRADATLPHFTAEALAKAMEKSGKRCELIRCEEQGHGSFNFGRGDGPYFRETLIRDGDWKLIEFYDYSKVELYDLKNDPSETKDLAATKPEKHRELLDNLHAWQKSVNAQIPSPDSRTGGEPSAPKRKKRK